MRILLCLVSEQHVPNLLSVHHFKPDRLVLVESEAMRLREVADHLLEALRQGGLDYADRHWREPLGREDSLPNVRRAVQAAHDRHPGAEWIVNLTGGLKPMAIATYQFFSGRDATPIYVNAAQPDEFRWMDRDEVEPFHYRPQIAEFLAGYGFRSRKAAADVATAEERAHSWWECSRTLAAQDLAGDLIPDEKIRKGAREKKRCILELDHINPAWVGIGPVRSALEQTFGLPGEIDKYRGEFLTGGWLEAYLWGVLSRHADELGIWDVRLGLEPARIGDPAGNDFDVSFLHRHRLVAVECKTGGQGHGAAGDILYKVEAIVRQFRALHVRTVLATTSDFLHKGGEIAPNIRDRASIYNCTILKRDWVRELATADDPVPLLRRGLKL